MTSLVAPLRGNLRSESVEPGVTCPLSEFQPVLALTILASDQDGVERIVSAVRSRQTNRTHPDVLSVPTMRVPADLAESWPTSCDKPELTGLNYAIEGLLARKIGLADAMETREFTYSVERIAGWQGYSRIGFDGTEDVVEALTMFNAIVRVESGFGLIPGSSASYSAIVKAPTGDFLESVERRDVSLVDPGLDQVETCIHGMCVETTRLVMAL